jgi:hypothetical protein
LIQMRAEEQLLKRLGLDLDVLESGCCGMAGAFGFEADHYDISMKVAEHELLPHVRKAAKDTLIIADGFSCREQVRQSTDRVPLHVAEVLQMALRNETYGAYPETKYVERAATRPSLLSLAALAGGVMMISVLLKMLRRKRDRF